METIKNMYFFSTSFFSAGPFGGPSRVPWLQVADLTSSFAALKMTSSCWQIYEGV